MVDLVAMLYVFDLFYVFTILSPTEAVRRARTAPKAFVFCDSVLVATAAWYNVLFFYAHNDFGLRVLYPFPHRL